MSLGMVHDPHKPTLSLLLANTLNLNCNNLNLMYSLSIFFTCYKFYIKNGLHFLYFLYKMQDVLFFLYYLKKLRNIDFNFT